MDAQKILEAARNYQVFLHECGARPTRHMADVPCTSKDKAINHLCFMAYEIPVLLDEGNKEKAGLWLDFIKRALKLKEPQTMEQFQDISRLV